MQISKANFKIEFKKRLYDFVLKQIGFIDSLPKDNVSFRLGDQLLRSSTSILANYVEGQSASSRKELTKFVEISLKSANETKVWLALLRDSNRADRKKTDAFLAECAEIAKILASATLGLKAKKI